VGAEFATHSTAVLRWLAYGVLLNSLAQIPFAYLQAAGRADLTARLHLIEAPLYVLGLWWAIRIGGVEGAAIAWTLRVAVDALVLFALTRRVSGVVIDRGSAWGMVLLLGSLALATLDLTPGLGLRVALAAATLGIFGVTMWRWLLDPAGREWIRARLVWSTGR
jgi:O-antigen/teichoic acid export membrane protein